MLTRPMTIADHEARFERYLDEVRVLQAARAWLHGPRDLMHLLGVQRDEVKHSRAIGWLLDPAGRHGLHDGLLRAILEAGWPGEALADPATTVVSLEVALGITRADIVVRSGRIVLVIENKVDAPEQPRQCQELVDEWTADERDSDLRFLFLTPTGFAPMSVCRPADAVRWRHMSYASLAAGLGDALAPPSLPSASARLVAEDYRATLVAMAGAARELAVYAGREEDAHDCARRHLEA